MDSSTFISDPQADGHPLWFVTEAGVDAWLATQSETCAAWLRTLQFRGERHRVLTIPDANGRVAGAVVGLGPLRLANELTLWHAAPLVERLPPGSYRVANELDERAATQCLLGWLTGGYRFTRYRNPPTGERPRLVAPTRADVRAATAAARASALARDLINQPANDLGPAELAAAAIDVARRGGSDAEIIEGDALLARGHRLIHAVGAASSRAPRLIDFRWGRVDAPKVTLVGKGVCFDSGGLDIKPSSGMLLMKKDMGGAACVLALAQLLIELEAPVRLRVLIPAVENSVSSNAYRPGDVIRSRKGLTVEIGNTDAEGRLVLADALAEADLEKPDLIVDLATLTGAARTALGPELPAAFASDAALLEQLRECGDREGDPLWPLPLWMGYDDELGSRVADLGNVSSTPFAGAIIGALFLKRFVTASPNWIHVDLYAWNSKDRPGRPVGAEAQCVRALHRLIRQRYG